MKNPNQHYVTSMTQLSTQGSLLIYAIEDETEIAGYMGVTCSVGADGERDSTDVTGHRGTFPPRSVNVASAYPGSPADDTEMTVLSYTTPRDFYISPYICRSGTPLGNAEWHLHLYIDDRTILTRNNWMKSNHLFYEEERIPSIFVKRGSLIRIAHYVLGNNMISDSDRTYYALSAHELGTM